MVFSFVPAQLSQFSPQFLTIFYVFATFLIASFVLLITIFLKYAIRRHNYSKQIPGKPVGFFEILGNLIDMPKIKETNAAILQLIGSYNKQLQKHKVFCIWMSYTPFLFFVKAEAMEELLSGTRILRKGLSYNFLHSWLGTGLLTSAGKKWKSRRKLLTPSFHFEILKDFLPIFNEQSQKLVTILQKETSKDYTNIVLPITLCSLDIICETTLGVTLGAQENKDSDYVKAVHRAGNIIVERQLHFTHWFDVTFMFTEAGKQLKTDLKLLHEFTRSVIREKKKKLLSGDTAVSEKKKRKALMDVLLEHHIQTKDLGEEDVREEVDTFAFEGHDTTSMGMSWALYLIGLHKDVQDKLHEEMDRIFGDDTERHATTDDLKDMTYLDRVLKESQRLYPSVPYFSRETTEDHIMSGYKVPKGTECVAMVYHLHRDEDVFPDAEKFDPDRFLPENCVNRHPYAYIPFSAGPRNCIGQRFAIMEEKVVVSTVLRNFTLESLDPRDKISVSAELVLRPIEPIRIKIRRRQFH